MTRQPIDRRAIPPGASLSEWLSPDGWPHRRLDWLQPKGAHVRGSLIFAGGRGDFIEKYLEADDHWHAMGWNVTSFDWRGQGASRGDIIGGHLESLDPLVGDLEALVRDWQASMRGPHVVIGHSMGGHVLLRALAESRVQLDAAVLVAPMLMINTGLLPGWIAPALASSLSIFGLDRQPAWPQGEKAPPAGSARQSILTGCPERYEDELWWFEREPGYDLGTPSWGWLNAAYRSCARVTEESLRGVETPLLIVATEKDRLVSAEAIRRAAKLLPNAELLMFQEAAHEILREADPIRMEALERIDRFLAGLSR